MEQALLKNFEARCTQDAPPACRAACPLHMDVRQFMHHMQSGQWGKARALLDKALPFASLLTALCEHPCESVCARESLGGAVAIGDMERACISFAPQMTKLVRVPTKSKRVGILGAGIAGLAAAWELALKGFAATIFHNGCSPESFLLESLQLSERNPEAHFAPLVMEALSALSNMGVAFTPVTEIGEPSIDGMEIILGKVRQENDGLFIDVRCFPSLISKEFALDVATGASGGDFSLCYGGLAPSAIMNAFEGRRGAITLGRVLSGASPSALREQEGPHTSSLHVDISGHAAQDRVVPASGTGAYSEAEAKAESGRCIACECMQCVKQCVYLRHYGEYPKIYARQMFLNLGIYTGYRRLNTQINSCALCGQCERICPENFSMSDFCLLLREEMVRQNKMPPSAHLFALQELEVSTAEESTLALGGHGQNACSHVLFPGCQLAAVRPSQVRFLFRHLRQTLAPEAGIWLDCCGIPAHFAGRVDLVHKQAARLESQWKDLGRPIVIMACASCLRYFREHLPSIPVCSLWEVLDKEAVLPPVSWQACSITKNGGESLVMGSIHDPCSAHDDVVWQESVRSLLRKAEFSFDEPAATGQTTACCGYGGLVWNANPEISAAMARDRADKLPADAVTSCIMCREQLLSAGKSSWHLLDILLPSEEMLTEWLAQNTPDTNIAAAYSCYTGQGLTAPFGEERPPGSRGPGFSRRRQTRILLKKVFRTVEFGLALEESVPESALELLMDEAVLDEVEQKHILKQDIAAVIFEAEKEKTFFYDRENERYLARHKTGTITFWVYYRKEANSYTILDAYKHRMEIALTPIQVP